MNRFEEGFGDWVVKVQWWLMAVCMLVAFAAASGLQFLTFSTDTRVFFSEQNPQLQALEALEDTYTENQNVLFVVAPKVGDIFTRRSLAVIEQLTERAWKMPYASRVDSITNFQHTRAREDHLIVEDLVKDAENLSDTDLQGIRDVALSESQLLNSLISMSGHVSGVNVNCIYPGESLADVPKIAGFASKLRDDLQEEYPNIDIYLTGTVMGDNAFSEVSQQDMATLVPMMFIVLLVLVGVTLRSFVGTFVTFTVIFMSMVTGIGLAGWLSISITPASVNAPLIIPTLAVADSVHILSTLIRQMRMGRTKREAIAFSLGDNLRAVFLTSATTAIGFLSMNLSDAPPFRDLGNIVAMGVTAAFIYSILFLPSLLSVLPIRVKPQLERAKCDCCRGLADFVVNQRKVLLWGTLVLCVILTSGTLRIEFNDNWFTYFSKRYDIRTATDFTQENLTGLDVIQYSLDSGEPGGINNPEYLAKVEEFANWYREQSKVLHVQSITDIMKRLNKNMHADDGSWYRIPEQRNLAAQYLLVYEMSLPFGLDLNDRINIDKSATRMVVTLRNTTTTELRDMDERARRWLKINAPENMFTYGSGLSIIWAHISERNIRSMLGASFGALMLISGIMIFALRSFRLGLVSLIPNLAPAVMAFGIWGLTVGQVGLGLSIVASMTIGIVVDDTVHFLSKYLRARKEHHLNPSGAVRYAFDNVGTAMSVTTVAVAAGFLVLTFSGYKMNADMGLLTSITVTLALALDFVLLPVLLMKVEGQTDETIVDHINHMHAPVPTGSHSRDG